MRYQYSIAAAAVIAVLATAPAVHAQAAADEPHVSTSVVVQTESSTTTSGQTERDPGIATILSVVIPGAGQMYAGDTMRGVKILGGAYFSPIIGWTAGTMFCATGSGAACGVGLLVGLTGSVAGLGSWVYGIIDAGPTTERMNAAHGFALDGRLQPLVAPTADGGTALGFRLTF